MKERTSMELTIDTIKNNINDMLNNKSYDKMQSSIDLLYQIYVQCIKNSLAPEKSKLVQEISDDFIELEETLLKSNLFVAGDKLVKKILDATNNNQLQYVNDILFRKWIDGLSLRRNAHELHASIDCYMELFYSYVFSTSKYRYCYFAILSMQNNVNINESSKCTLTLLFAKCFSRLDHNELNKKCLYSIFQYLFNNMFKSPKFQKIINDLICEIFVQNRLELQLRRGLEKLDSIEVLLAIGIYIYYAVNIESSSVVIQKTYTDIADILRNNKPTDHNTNFFNLLQFVNSLHENIWLYYKDIQSVLTMDGWEYVPLNMWKPMRMTNVIRDFYIFYSETYIDANLQDLRLVLKDITYNDLLILLEAYPDMEHFSDDLGCKYKDFINLFSENIGHDVSDLHKSSFVNTLADQFFMAEKTNLARAKYFVDKINKNIDNLQDNIYEKLEKSPLYDSTLESGTSKIINSDIDIEYLAETKNIFGYEDMGKEINSTISNLIFNNLVHDSQTINANNNDNLVNELLIGIKQIFNSDDKIVIFNRKLTDLYEVSYCEDIKSIKFISDFESKASFKNSGLYFPIVISTSDIRISYKVKAIKDKRYSNTEILKNLENRYDDNIKMYKIPIVNNIVVSLNREDAISYYKDKYYGLEIDVIIGYIKPRKSLALIFKN